MGTHPIFESDFDCLTDKEIGSEMLRVNNVIHPRRYLRVSLPVLNYYRTLEIDRQATKEDIKKAHKAIARKYHPDRPGGDKEKFIAAQEAFECLYDASSREKYD